MKSIGIAFAYVVLIAIGTAALLSYFDVLVP
jgi:hypothetical protein